jgi:class 3 adenylate cyclase
MQCNKCGFNNPQGMDFCGRCATKLNHVCPNCYLANLTYSRICSQCGHKLSDTLSGHSRKAPQHDNAERRQLTILFCDIVNSSALSAKIDPEDLRDIIREYRTTCSEVIARHDGHIAQHLGDGILVYFGYPRAHEDDARRAAHAGLQIIQHISEFHFQIDNNTCIQLAVRIGIHTGLVVVGEIGDDDKRTLALGETPNIAARIQNHANENTLVVSSTTHQLLGREFDSYSLGHPSLRGFSQPLELFRIDKFCRTSDRIPEPHNDNTAPLIGREKETALLLKKVEQAQNGTGQIALLHGEPGLGKTRIAQFVCKNIPLSKYTLLECAGIPFFQHSFFHPVIQLIQRMIGLTNNMDECEKIFKIEQISTDLGLDPEITTPILADLLSLPLNKQYPINIESTPQQKKQLTIDIFLKILTSLTKRNYVLFIVEDIQWIDPSTLELLTQIIYQKGLTNIFALFTSRNDFSIPTPRRDHITQITLNHLDKQESGRLIQYLCDNKPLPREVLEKIVAKTDGVPFFIEEVTNSLLHSDSLIEKNNHYELSVPLTRVEIPVTLNDSLASKLDNLGENKKLAQLCSILGREFYHELLRAIYE